MRKKCFLYLALLLLCIFATGPLRPQLVSAAEVTDFPPLIIRELQTDGLQGTTVDGTKEFVELYNPSDQALDVSGWQVQYLSASNNGTGNPTRVLATLEGSVAPQGYVLLSYHDYMPDADVYFGAGSTSSSGWLAHSGGHVRIVDAAGATIDAVTWGNGMVISGWWRSPELPPGDAIQRILPADPAYTGKSIFTTPGPAVPPLSGDLLLPTASPQPPCTGLILSEILPDPAGSDAGNEFIEITNPTTESIPLQDCSLRIGDNGTPFRLPDELLAPAAYRAFSDTESGLVLPNAAAQTVWLTTSSTEQGVMYPNNMSDGESWALIDGTWQITTRPTPGATNIASPEEAVEVSATDTAPACPVGKERNPDTNRCRTLETGGTTLVSCPTGQARNPSSGRCRKVVDESSPSLQPCKEGQERSPETNRCRAVLGTTTASTPCGPGQERNPQTNRCRKAAGSSSLASVQDVKTNPRRNSFTWWVLGMGVMGVAGYGIYEWRHDIQNRLYIRRMRRKHTKREIK